MKGPRKPSLSELLKVHFAHPLSPEILFPVTQQDLEAPKLRTITTAMATRKVSSKVSPTTMCTE